MIARIRKAMEEREGGFTLIELLVVIIIIGILAAIAIPVFLNQRKKGFEASEKSDLRTVANEMETYYTDFSTYPAPSGSSSLTIGSDTVKLSTGNTVSTLANGNNGFCLQMVSSKTNKVWYYDSLNGGLTSSTSCASAAAGTY
jgi:prepilin-type N-terminal cleavage/methylation domain-containing protein